jgi:hypothetical protein
MDMQRHAIPCRDHDGPVSQRSNWISNDFVAFECLSTLTIINNNLIYKALIPNGPKAHFNNAVLCAMAFNSRTNSALRCSTALVTLQD